jgi:uncharacterized protein YjiS (DUF1127 family)
MGCHSLPIGAVSLLAAPLRGETNMSMVTQKTATRLAGRPVARSALGTVLSVFTGWWRLHRTRRALDRMSNASLHDIGLHRDESLSTMNPFSSYRPWDGL